LRCMWAKCGSFILWQLYSMGTHQEKYIVGLMKE
jgi:hypothetical protein